jgi:hypothetical protein
VTLSRPIVYLFLYQKAYLEQMRHIYGKQFWHEQVTFSQDDDDDNDMTALYKSNTLLLAH